MTSPLPLALTRLGSSLNVITEDRRHSTLMYHGNFRGRHGKVHTRMLHCVYMLTDHGPEEGCLAVVGVAANDTGLIDRRRTDHLRRKLDRFRQAYSLRAL